MRPGCDQRRDRHTKSRRVAASIAGLALLAIVFIHTVVAQESSDGGFASVPVASDQVVAGAPVPVARLLADVNPGQADSSPRGFVDVGGTLFFSAYDDAAGRELWKSDWTAAGTIRVKDIEPGPITSSPTDLVDVNGTLFFAAGDDTAGFELWKSDGTESGTVPIDSIRGPEGLDPYDLVYVNVNGKDTVFFVGDDGMTGDELWNSDGTEEGTFLVKDISPGPSGSFPTDLVNVNGTLFFAAYDPDHGYELWKSNGTNETTQLVRDIAAGPGSSDPEELVNVGGRLFFRASDGATDGLSGDELWTSNGTQLGTKRVRDIAAGIFGSFPARLVALDAPLNSTLFFWADDYVTPGYDLWKSDGTEENTIKVREFLGQPPGELAFAVLGNVLLFAGSDGPINGRELWGSDGTSPGTGLLKDIYAGPDSSSPNDLVAAGDEVFFAASTRDEGRELWTTDGTPAGTRLLGDLYPGPQSSAPFGLSNAGGILVFEAEGPLVGREPWIVAPCGDGIKQSGEQCEAPVGAGTCCTTTCAFAGAGTMCQPPANGRCDAFGACTAIGVTTTTATTTTDTTVNVTTTSVPSLCGNGVVEAPREDCDPGDPYYSPECCYRCHPVQNNPLCTLGEDYPFQLCENRRPQGTCDNTGRCVATRKLENELCRQEGTLGNCDAGDFCDGVRPDCPRANSETGCDATVSVTDRVIRVDCRALLDLGPKGVSFCEAEGVAAGVLSLAATGSGEDGGRLTKKKKSKRRMKRKRTGEFRRTVILHLNGSGRRRLRESGTLQLTVLARITHGGSIKSIPPVPVTLSRGKPRTSHGATRESPSPVRRESFPDHFGR
jgi:ELWxxDGT repeat protein